MVDVHTPDQRSRNMAAIRGQDTKPEMLVRSMLHRMGLRFSLHRKDLPGKPDIVLPKHRAVVLVHGCFWHRHAGCRFSTTPQTRAAFWQEKFDGNIKRDQVKAQQLRRLGWRVLTVWECETRHPKKLGKRLGKLFADKA